MLGFKFCLADVCQEKIYRGSYTVCKWLIHSFKAKLALPEQLPKSNVREGLHPGGIWVIIVRNILVTKATNEVAVLLTIVPVCSHIVTCDWLELQLASRLWHSVIPPYKDT